MFSTHVRPREALPSAPKARICRAARDKYRVSGKKPLSRFRTPASETGQLGKNGAKRKEEPGGQRVPPPVGFEFPGRTAEANITDEVDEWAETRRLLSDRRDLVLDYPDGLLSLLHLRNQLKNACKHERFGDSPFLFVEWWPRIAGENLRSLACLRAAAADDIHNTAPFAGERGNS